MTKRPVIRISRAGLTRCPECQAHTKLDAPPTIHSRCVFCGARLATFATDDLTRQTWQTRGTDGALAAMLRGGRGSLVAASLFGLSLGAGCLDSRDGQVGLVQDVAADVSDSGGGQDAVGDVGGVGDAGLDAPSSDVGLEAVGSDVSPQPIEDVVEDIPAEVPNVIPLYGGPPPIDVMVSDVPPESVDGPLYGLPSPTFDAGDSDADADADADGSDSEVHVEVIEPAPPEDMYGVPPDGEF